MRIDDFESLYRRMFPQSMRMAVTLLHDEDEARDAVQSVFMRLWELPPAALSPDAFIIAAVKNEALNRLRRKALHERVMHMLPLLADDTPFDTEALVSRLDAAMEQLLTPRDREVITAVFYQGLSYREAASALGISVSAINKHIVNSLRTLRKYFTRL